MLNFIDIINDIYERLRKVEKNYLRLGATIIKQKLALIGAAMFGSFLYDALEAFLKLF